MKYIPYTKPFQTPSQILDKLINNGLIVNDATFEKAYSVYCFDEESLL